MKIGRSWNPLTRLNTVRGSNPEQVDILIVLGGQGDLESLYQDATVYPQSGGGTEWVRVPDRVLRDLDAIPKDSDLWDVLRRTKNKNQEAWVGRQKAPPGESVRTRGRKRTAEALEVILETVPQEVRNARIAESARVRSQERKKDPVAMAKDRARGRDRYRERYATDPVFREKERERVRKVQGQPEYQERQRQRKRAAYARKKAEREGKG